MNIAPTKQACARFAPTSTRERSAPSGRIGSAARACRTTNPASSAAAATPVGRRGDEPAQHQAGRGADRTHEGVGAHGAAAPGVVGVERGEHPEGDRRRERSPDALDEPRDDEPPRAGREAARQRGDGEQRHPREEHPAAADQVAEPPGEQQESAEADQVGVDDPGERPGVEAEVPLDGRDGDRRDRLVDRLLIDDPSGALRAGEHFPWS
ncbi:MAG TPA: hypothetical protein VGH76_17555 [Actinomycetospora sp.]